MRKGEPAGAPVFRRTLVSGQAALIACSQGGTQPRRNREGILTEPGVDDDPGRFDQTAASAAPLRKAWNGWNTRQRITATVDAANASTSDAGLAREVAPLARASHPFA
jgi:hypothetical protein